MSWLLHKDEARASVAAYERALKISAMTNAEAAVELGITAEAVAGLRVTASVHELPEVRGGVAYIQVRGILLESRVPFLDFIGAEYSDYETIITQIAAAESDSEVASIVFEFDSPGGMVAGMFDAAAAISSASKPTRGVIDGMAASAAYTLISQVVAGEIEATNRGDLIGSVGILASIFVNESVVDITSTEAPNKSPDVRTEEGKAVVQELLDQMHELMATTIAAGRGISVDDVNRDFGRGALMLADRALEAGMIDSISTPEGQPAMATSTQDNQATGVRAALGLDKNTDKEELIRACISVKARADAHDEMEAKLHQQIALNEAAKDQLTKAKAQVEEIQANDEKRKAEAFTARRSAVLNQAVADNKILPAQVEKYTAIAADEKGLKGLEDLFAVTAPMGLTTESTAIKTPKGTSSAETPEQYAKTYNCDIPTAKRRLAERAERKANQ